MTLSKPTFAQSLRVHVGISHSAQQHRHIRRPRSPIAQGCEALGNVPRGFLDRLSARNPGSGCGGCLVMDDIEANSLEIGEDGVLLPVNRAARVKMQELGAESTVLAENGVDESQDVAVAAEVIGKAHEMSSIRQATQRLAILEEHVDVRPSKR